MAAALARAGPPLLIETVGQSMRPMIVPGSLLTVDTSQGAWQRITAGSVIVFRNSRDATGLTAHMAVSSPFAGFWRTKGTNLLTNPRPDAGLVPRASFVGLVVKIEKPAKKP